MQMKSTVSETWPSQTKHLNRQVELHPWSLGTQPEVTELEGATNTYYIYVKEETPDYCTFQVSPQTPQLVTSIHPDKNNSLPLTVIHKDAIMQAPHGQGMSIRDAAFFQVRVAPGEFVYLDQGFITLSHTPDL